MNQTFHNRSDTDAEVIATLTAISQVSARMAKNLRLIAIHRQSKEGGTTISMIQSIINDHKREKREQEKDKRDLEYHEKRMKDFK